MSHFVVKTLPLTKRTAINKVKKFAGEVKSTGLHLHKVILFSSYASNKQGEWSDIDIALVADEFTGLGYYDRAYFARINNKKLFLKRRWKILIMKGF